MPQQQDTPTIAWAKVRIKILGGINNDFQGKEGQTVPEMTPEVVANITNRYIELYEHITGTKFEKADSTNILARIENNVNECLASLK